MDRSLKRLAIAAAVCVLCAVIFCLAVRKEETVDTPDVQDETLYVDNINLNSVAGLVLKNENGAVPLMIYDGEIQFIDAPADTEMDTSVIKAFAYRMTHIPAKEKIGKVESLSDFGLENPASAVSIILSNGETVRVALGDEAPFDNGYYIRSENGEDVYLTDGITARMLRYGTDDFRRLDVLPEIPTGVSLKDLTGFGLIRGDEIIEITGTQGADGMTYMLRRPFEALLDWENVASYIYSPFICLDECSFVSADGDFEKYGLEDDGVCSLIASLAGKTFRMYFADAGDGTYYVCRDGSKQIVRVKSELLPFLNVQLSELVSDTVYSVGAAELSAVHIEADGLDYSATITGSGEDIRTVIGDRVLSASETVSFVKTVTMLPRAGMLTDEADITGKPILRLSLSLRDGRENMIELTPVSDWYCAVIVDGSCVTATYTSTVNEIISEVNAFIGG